MIVFSRDCRHRRAGQFMDDDLSLLSPKCLLIANWKACAAEPFYQLLIKAEGLCEEKGQSDTTMRIGMYLKTQKSLNKEKKVYDRESFFITFRFRLADVLPLSLQPPIIPKC